MGLGLAIAGGLALSNLSNINTDHIKPLLDSVKVGSFQAGSMVNNLSILIIVIGVFILVVSGLGLFGSCCQNKCMLTTVSLNCLSITIKMLVSPYIVFSCILCVWMFVLLYITSNLSTPFVFWDATKI